MRALHRTIVIAGSIAQRPGIAGHAWMFLQYLLGFKDLGYDVVFVDRLEPGGSNDASGAPCPVERSVQRRDAVGKAKVVEEEAPDYLLRLSLVHFHDLSILAIPAA